MPTLLDDLLAADQADAAADQPRLDLVTWSRSIRLPYDGGPAEGQAFDPQSHPAHYFILSAMASGRYDRFVLLGPTQDGKTWAGLIIPALHALSQQRESVVIALPTRLLLDRLWQSKLLPAFQSCGVADLLPASGLGSEGGTPTNLLCTNGARIYLLGAGTRNENALAGVTARHVWVDEADDMQPARRINLAFARADAWGARGRRYLTSTLKSDDPKRSNVQRGIAGSTGHRVWWPCPACHRYQLWTWAQVSYDATDNDIAATSARIACVNCGVVHDEKARHAATLLGRVVPGGQVIDEAGALIGTARRSTTCGLTWSALDSPLRDLGDLCRLHRDACAERDEQGDHSALRQFFRDHLVTGYTGDQADIDDGVKPLEPSMLMTRSKTHGWAEILRDRDDNGLFSRCTAPLPETFTRAVLAVDVQLDRIYWSIIAAGPHGRTADLAWGYEVTTQPPQPLAPGELGDLLDRLDLATASLHLPIDARIVDTGYQEHGDHAAPAHVEAELITWLSAHRGRWAGCRGVDRLPANVRAIVPGLVAWDPAWRPGLGRWLIDADRIRTAVHAAWRTAPDAPGAGLLPAGLLPGEHYLRHACALVQVTDPKSHATTWKRRQSRHDWLDCRGYATAVLRALLARALLAARPQSSRPANAGTIGV